MDISVITVTWNSKDLIGKQIASVKKGVKNSSIEQIIIDNGSSDGTVEYINKHHADVIVIANTENKGFGGANTQGVNIATGEFLLFLNPDMQVEPGSLDIMLEWMKRHQNIGIASPKLVDEHGNFNWDASPRRFPKLWEQLALILKIPHVFPSIMNHYHMKDLDINKEQEVDTVRGAFVLMRREIVDQLGWAWDPRYFFWYEDVDICREVKRLGYKVMYTPMITCVDYVGQSIKKRTTLWKQKQFTSSMLIYFKKWDPWYRWMWIALLRPIGIALAWVNDRIHTLRTKK